MRRARGPCGWCLTGDCCEAPGSRAVRLIDCTHTEGCEVERDTEGWVPTRDTVGWCSAHAVDHHSQPCDQGGPNHKGVMLMNIVSTAWKQLDEQVDEIVDIVTQIGRARAVLQPTAEQDDLLARLQTDLTTAKGRARGKAEILALMMAPHFTTADEISQEASVRRAARDAGALHVTPGVLRESKAAGWYHDPSGHGFTAGIEVTLQQEREEAERQYAGWAASAPDPLSQAQTTEGASS